MDRQEQLKNNIEETEQEIKGFELVIQGLDKIKETTKNQEAKIELKELINNFNNNIKFLEDIKQSDEDYLNKNGLV